MIIYGIRFDTDREGLGNGASWTLQQDMQFTGDTLRISFDSLPTCQADCLTRAQCAGVMIREVDGACYEMTGSTAPSTIATDLYLLKDNRITVSDKWVISLVISTLISLCLDGLKVVLLVTLIWYCYGQRMKRKMESRMDMSHEGKNGIELNIVGNGVNEIAPALERADDTDVEPVNPDDLFSGIASPSADRNPVLAGRDPVTTDDQLAESTRSIDHDEVFVQ